MKLQELFEDHDVVVGPLKDLIERECKGFLNRAGHNGLLYRGVNLPGHYEGLFSVSDFKVIPVYRKKVRKNRETTSMPETLSKELDKWFEENFGFRARSGAVFCLGEAGRRTAEGYGRIETMLFPVGKFSYVWSPNVDDLFYQIGHMSRADFMTNDYFDMDKLDAVMKQFKFTNNRLDEAVKSNCEIMIDCDEVLLVKYKGTSQARLVHDALGINFKS